MLSTGAFWLAFVILSRQSAFRPRKPAILPLVWVFLVWETGPERWEQRPAPGCAHLDMLHVGPDPLLSFGAER